MIMITNIVILIIRLFYLTFSMELQKHINIDILPLLLDRLLVASQLLLEVFDTSLSFYTLTHPQQDVVKNTALSWLRLNDLVTLTIKFKSDFETSVKKSLTMKVFIIFVIIIIIIIIVWYYYY